MKTTRKPGRSLAVMALSAAAVLAAAPSSAMRGAACSTPA